jgi:hypothetical protein
MLAAGKSKNRTMKMNTKPQIIVQLSFALTLVLSIYGCASVSTVSSTEPPEFPEFPWPPPEASASVEISELVKEPKDEITRLGDVDKKLRRAFEAAGYVEKSYFAVPDGFALVTRLEQMNPDGTPRDPGRWSLEKEPLRNFSLREYLRALFFADPGLFRVVVFIVTPHPFSQSDKVVERDEAMDWLRAGLDRLPSSVASQEYTDEFRTTALIYQFENPESGEPRLSPSRLTGRDHLAGSGFLLNLENR